MASILNTLRTTAAGLFSKREDSVLGIDISSSTIKVVQLGRSKGRAILETYGELALGPYAGTDTGRSTSLSPAKLGEAVADLVREAKGTATACGVALPLSASLIHVVEMPDVSDDKLKTMVPIEVRKYIPVAISEVMLDWRAVPRIYAESSQADVVEEQKEEEKNTLKKIDVLTVAIHRDTITRYQDVMKTAGLSPSFYEIEVFSTIRSVLEEDLAPTMIIGIGAGNTKAYIVDRKVLRESHIINRGSQEATLAISRAMNVSESRAEELKHTYGLIKEGKDTDVAEIVSLVFDSIFTEARHVMEGYQKKHSRNVGRVILTGGGSLTPGIVDRAKTAFQIEASIADPFKKLEAPAFLDSVLKEIGPSFDVAIGVALRKLEEER